MLVWFGVEYLTSLLGYCPHPVTVQYSLYRMRIMQAVTVRELYSTLNLGAKTFLVGAIPKVAGSL